MVPAASFGEAGRATVGAAPGESVEAEIPMPRRAFAMRDEESASWRFVSGSFEVQASHSLDDRRLAATLEVRDPDRPGAVPDSRPGVQARAASA
ncbi:fibronectin type III-like domain-contianing protein [Streptomyces sp. NPDC059881]|uniref:fibronectin type III-like domain-contianing protein n=1 Tax=Streptomyces sp. NPDC059881 TaxID=3346986 RepID=UPI00365F65B2